MTQKEATILVEIITKVVRKELGAFKKQLLQEGYSPQPVRKQVAPQPTDRLTEVHKNFRNSFKPTNQAQNRRLSRDPLLNSILQETVSIEEAERGAEQAGLLDNINLPVDANGRIIFSNANVDHVIEAMNRDYSGMFAQNKRKAPTTNTRSQFRESVVAMMERDDHMPTQNQPSKSMTGFPAVEPFSGEEEDMTWLNEVQ